jgi:hypothetical protein
MRATLNGISLGARMMIGRALVALRCPAGRWRLLGMSAQLESEARYTPTLFQLFAQDKRRE